MMQPKNVTGMTAWWLPISVLQ